MSFSPPVAALALGLLLVSSACFLHDLAPFFGGHWKMRVEIAHDLNRRSPVAVEALVVYDRTLLKTLASMSARDWFDQRRQILDAQGKKHRFDHWAWEWVPAQEVPDQKLPYHSGAAGGVIFADYLTPGDHRVLFDPMKPILLRLERSTLAVEPGGGG